MSPPGDPATWRLFVALPVPAPVRAIALAARAPAEASTPGLTWTRPEGWHVTLAFLGPVPVEDVPRVREVVGAAVAGVAPPALELGEPGRFGRKVLWLAVGDRPAGSVAALGEAVQAALAAAHLPVQRQPLRPHLTLARAKGRGGQVTDAVVGAVAPARAGWEAEEVELVRSRLGGGPARYEAVASWPLVGDA